jgi:transposase
MAEFVIAGLDVHDKNTLMKMASDKAPPDARSFPNTRDGRAAMFADLRRRREKALARRVVVGYEASGAGYGLHDDVTDAGSECHVVAPNRMKRSHKGRRMKTDERGAEMACHMYGSRSRRRGVLLRPSCPRPRAAPDREVVTELMRSRLDASERLATLKGQVRNLLKRNGLRRPKLTGKGWTERFGRRVLGLLRREGGPAGVGTRRVLETHLRQMKLFESEVATLDGHVAELARTPRYRARVEALVGEIKGVGVHVAMVFLTEMGDLPAHRAGPTSGANPPGTRFRNRREVAAYVGLVPSSDESGE